MDELRVILTSDGSSDSAFLIPIIKWLLNQHLPDMPFQTEWAEIDRRKNERHTVANRIAACLELYKCDLLFIHRDAEREPRSHRINEIQTAINGINPRPREPIVPVVPVRMQEAWLLVDERAIRYAAGNPNGRVHLNMPRRERIEEIPDPKQILHELLRTASEFSGRRRAKFNAHHHATNVSDCIADFAVLRCIPAFRSLEDDTRAALASIGLIQS